MSETQGNIFTRALGALSGLTQVFNTQETVSDTQSISGSQYEAIGREYDGRLPPARTDSNITLVDPLPSRGATKRSASEVFGSDEDQPNTRRKLTKRKLSEIAPPQLVEGTQFIAHSSLHTHFFSNLSWGVTYEIHRWISTGKITFDALDLRKVTKLTGPDAVAVPKAVDILLDGKETMPAESDMEHLSAAKSPWAAMDLEREKLKANPLAGLGLSDGERWFGGTVDFTGTLALIPKPAHRGGDRFHIVLNPPEVAPSRRFRRRYGSESFFRVKIPQNLRNKYKDDTLQRFFASNKFIIAGRAFRSFYEEDNSVHMVLTNEPYEGDKVAPPPYTNELRCSLLQFIDDHNDPVNNAGQTMTKWRARIKLGISETEPAMLVPTENIHFCKDILASSTAEARRATSLAQTLEPSSKNPDTKDKIPAHEIMTDGCGLINYAGLKKIQSTINPNAEGIPVVFQVRIGGYKGLLLLDPRQKQEEPHIWLVDSQRKIVFDDSPHPSHLIIDVVRPPHFVFPASLSKEMMINLSHNNVSTLVFEKLLNENLRESTADLYQWSTDGSRLRLSHAVEAAGGVIHGKIARAAGGTARARGLATWISKDSELVDEVGDEVESGADSVEDDTWSWDPASGLPPSVYEVVKVMLDCGFTPTNSVYLREKLKCVLDMIIGRSLNKLKIPLKYSAEGFAVPDFGGQLEPGTIFVKSSIPLPMPDGTTSDILLGDALVVRHPCKVPSDVQKVRAVNRPGLHHFKNVVMFPTEGKRSPMSYLGGGDYDGDTVVVIWDPDLVNSFTNPDPKFADPPCGEDFVKCFPKSHQGSVDLPKSLDDCFRKDNEDVDEFLKRTRDLGDGAKTFEMQMHLMSSLAQESMVGICSNLHDKVAYRYGYGSHQAWLFAYLFTTCLDGVKTGKILIPEILQLAIGDLKGYLGYTREISKLMDKPVTDNELAIKYFRKGKTFVMDTLVESAKKSKSLRLGEWHQLFPPFTPIDADLLEPWNEAQEKGKAGGAYSAAHERALRAVEEYVTVRMKHFYKNQPARTKSSSERRAIEREASAAFWSGLPEEATAIHGQKSLQELAASTTYKLDETHQTRRFAFCVAFRFLCAIKASQATGGRYVTVKQGTYEYMSASSLARKRLP